MSEQRLLHLDRVSYRYGRGSEALAELSLEVGKGEAIVVLGANGCGKSTLLKMLGGLIWPSQGRYDAFGQNVNRQSLTGTSFSVSFRKEVGIVFQNSDAQLFNPTVADEIAFGPRQLGLSGAPLDALVAKSLEEFALGQLASRSPFALSGGEKKRVAIAAVLATDPSVLLLDEPTAGLDPRSNRLLLDRIIEARQRGKTLVLATHDLHIVPEIATRVVVMGEDRRILASGPPRELLGDRALLRSANLVHVHKHLHNGEWHEHEHEHYWPWQEGDGGSGHEGHGHPHPHGHDDGHEH